MKGGLKKRMNKFSKLFLLSVLSVVLLSATVLAIEPFGANVTSLSNSTAPADTPQSTQAFAGNITELGIVGYSTTQSWQGYFGNVTGTIQLADGGDNVMYNWSVASPQGEIYASVNSSITWGAITCLLPTSLGDDNFVPLETSYGITYDDVDGVNETFTKGGLLDHDTFYTANVAFPAGTCYSAHLFSAANTSEDHKFQEVLLYDTTSVIFASLLNEDLPGFDANPHDFEMMVLENGHLTDISPTTYYFWVELQ